MLKHEVKLVWCIFMLMQANSKIISTKTGDVAGKSVNLFGQQVEAYLGIPYAVPPLGELRFKPPIPINPWKGIYYATRDPPSCMQITCLGICSEDCLFLNIWVPSNGTDSVMVWIHGGAFSAGSISREVYDGSVMAEVGGVIVASINYRLGPFGFLYSGTDDARGNMAMKDQVLALRWIKHNIEAFGGNPSKITIFGQSTGSLSVSLHLISPMTRNLFSSAIMQSGSSYHPFFAARNTSLTKSRYNKLAMITGCALLNQDISDPNVMRCMRKLSASSILSAEATFTINMAKSDEIIWLLLPTPIYGDDYLPNPPIQEFSAGKIHSGIQNIMIGNVADEGSLFLLFLVAPYLGLINYPPVVKPVAASYIKRFFRGSTSPTPGVVADYYLANSSYFDSTLIKTACDTGGDWVFNCPSVFLSETVSAQDVYYYTYTHRWSKSPYKKWMGVVHADELKFVFGLPLRFSNLFTYEEIVFSTELIEVWTSFAKEGKPRYRKLSDEWPLYNSKKVAVDLNAYNVRYQIPYKDECRFWKKYF